MKTTLAVAALIFALFACRDKDETVPECEQFGLGWVDFINQSDSGYYIMQPIDTNVIIGTVGPGMTIRVEHAVGSYKFIAKTGWTTGNSRMDYTLRVDKCAATQYVIP